MRASGQAGCEERERMGGLNIRLGEKGEEGK